MTLQKVSINCTTGATEYVDLTTDEIRLQTLERDIEAAKTFVYAGINVQNADDVDRATIQRIRNLIAPNKPVELQAAAEIKLNSVTNYLNAKMTRARSISQAERDTLDAHIALWEQIEIIRAEGSSFKILHNFI